MAFGMCPQLAARNYASRHIEANVALRVQNCLSATVRRPIRQNPMEACGRPRRANNQFDDSRRPGSCPQCSGTPRRGVTSLQKSCRGEHTNSANGTWGLVS